MTTAIALSPATSSFSPYDGEPNRGSLVESLTQFFTYPSGKALGTFGVIQRQPPSTASEYAPEYSYGDSALGASAYAADEELGAYSGSDVKDSVRRRIFDLLKYAMEDDEAFPAARSIESMDRFLSENSVKMSPLIASDSNGRLIATWRISQDSMLSIKFFEDDTVEYAWALESGKKVKRNWGQANWKELLQSFPSASVFLDGGS
jgi:hypothetical protein